MTLSERFNEQAAQQTAADLVGVSVGELFPVDTAGRNMTPLVYSNDPEFLAFAADNEVRVGFSDHLLAPDQRAELINELLARLLPRRCWECEPHSYVTCGRRGWNYPPKPDGFKRRKWRALCRQWWHITGVVR